MPRMTRTAKRRFTRELQSVVDGIAFGASGPVLLHVYDPPAGGMWIDDLIPGKAAALEHGTCKRMTLGSSCPRRPASCQAPRFASAAGA